MSNQFLNVTAITFTLLALLAGQHKALAQGEIDEFLNASSTDAATGVQNYITPLLKGFGYGLNAGWYNTAKPHKKLGFDITVTGSLALVPDKDLTFTFLNSSYESIRLASGQTQTDLPTIFGPGTNESIEVFDPGSGLVMGNFTAPDGIDLNTEIGSFVPVPMVQAGIGLVKNTEIRVRFLPTITIEDIDINLYGIGILHDIKQHIPGIKNLPIDLSVFVGYTRLSSEIEVDGTFDNLGTTQIAEFDVDGLTLEALASKKFSVLTIYGSVGFNRASSDFAFKGTYDLDENGTASANEVNPLAIGISDSSLRALLGLRLKLGVITLHGDYSVNGYNTVTAGIGISVR